MVQQYDVTSVGVNPAEDRAHRMRMYLLAMSLRVLCVVSLFWVRGWWILLVGIGAVVLPYVAVLIGNAVAHGGGTPHTAPSPLELTGGDPDGPAAETSNVAPATIIIDTPQLQERPSAADGDGGTP